MTPASAPVTLERERRIMAHLTSQTALPRGGGDVPGSSARGIFLSYRRDAPVFIDLDSIEPGLDFAEVIREAVESCAVLVALIGRQAA